MCTPMFIAAMSTIAKLWKELRCPSTDEWIKEKWHIYIYIKWHIIQPLKRVVAICNDMDGARLYYAKRNKSIRERQLSQDLTDMQDLRNRAKDHRGREEKLKQNETREGDKPEETLNLRIQIEGCWSGGG